MGNDQNKKTFPLPKRGADCHRIILKVAPADIAYLVMVIESYETLGVARTVNQADGIVEILASPDYAADAMALIEALKLEMGMEVIKA